MDQNSGLNTMNLNAAIASLNSSGYGGFNSGQMTNMMSGLSNMASSMASMNPVGMMGSEQYNPAQPYHQQAYHPQPTSYQPQYTQQSQLQHYQPQQQPQPQYNQRAFQHQPALPMPSSMNSLEGTNNGIGGIDDRSAANDYREFKEKTLDVCREFMRGFCNRNEERCKFAHPPPFVDVKDGKVIVCFDYTKNRCRRTQPPCRYMHPPSHLCPDFGNTGAPVRRTNSGRMNDYGGGRDGYGRRGGEGYRSYDRGGHMYDDRYDGYSGSRRGNGGYGESQWGPPPSRGGNRRDDRRDTRLPRSGSTWTYQPKYTDGQRSDQIEVCREYMRNNCDRQECKYAHPPSHVKVENGHVVYCIDYVVKGSCRKNDECRYFHMPRHLAIRYGKIDPRGIKRSYDDMRDGDRIGRNYSPRSEDQQRSEDDTKSEDRQRSEDDTKSEDHQRHEDDQNDDERLMRDQNNVENLVKEELKNEPESVQSSDDFKVLDSYDSWKETKVIVVSPEEDAKQDEDVSKSEPMKAEEAANISAEDLVVQDEETETRSVVEDNQADEVEREPLRETECSDMYDPAKEVAQTEEDDFEAQEVGKVEDFPAGEDALKENVEESKDVEVAKVDDDEEAYIEGPPQKRIALDADLVQEHQSG